MVLRLLVIALVACSAPAPREPANLPDDPWGYFIDEATIATYVEKLSRTHRPQAVAFRDISVAGQVTTVVVEGGVIRAIGGAAPANAVIVDGRGKFLIPGLVDMHVHSNLSDAQYLLDLVNGVTSVREMNGSPSLLAPRGLARENRMLFPNLYLTGPILVTAKPDWYATVVETPDAARAEVRRQKAAGYDFIKVHNIVARDVYFAICEETKAIGIDLVGHIPHNTSVAEGIACGQRTFEHFKGYINDRNLQLTGEDYVAATRGAEVWNTPTFHNYRTHLRGDEAKRFVREAPEMRYVSGRDRAAWIEQADVPVKPIQHEVLRLSKKIFTDLRTIGARFLTGTDSGGGYPYHIRGFSLHEELRVMASLGMTGDELLAAATIEPARAMRRTDFGQIAVGQRADLVVLRGAHAFDDIDGVMVRGIWLSRQTLDEILAELARIAEPHARTKSELMHALDALAALRARGHVLRPQFLGWLRYRLDAAGMTHALVDGVAPLEPE